MNKSVDFVIISSWFRHSSFDSSFTHGHHRLDAQNSTGPRALYLPAILGGMAITFRHLKNMLLGRTKVTMQYPEEKWDSHMPEHYRGAPALVRDETGRVRCVACQLCEFICPPRAIKIVPGEIPAGDRFAKVEKYPEEFDIDMIRCIYCGLCEEVCPEQAIYLRKDYAITGFTRADMVHNKEKLLEIGGVMHGVVLEMEREEMK